MDEENSRENCNHHNINLYNILNSSVLCTFVSSILSIIGSLLIIATFVLWKDVRRSTVRIILLFLAIADLGTSVGYLTAAIGFKAFFNEKHNLSLTHEYTYFCRVQSFITTAFPVSSFFWTACMGLYFLLALVFRRPHWGPKLLIIFNIICWGLPFTLSIIMVLLHILGPPGNNSSSISGAWCFVGDSKFTRDRASYLKFEAVCGKLWEVLSYFVVAACYITILVSNRCHRLFQVRSGGGSIAVNSFQKVSEVLSNLDLKLMMIPVVFILLRMWGTVRYFASMPKVCEIQEYNQTNTNFCMESKCYYALYHFTFYLQAFCDPAQGFGNAIIFILFSKIIRFRLMKLVYTMIVKLCCCCCCRETEEEEEPDDGPLLHVPEKSNKKGFRVTYSPSTAKRRLPSNSGGNEPVRSPTTFDESNVEIQYGSFSSTIT